MDSACRRVEGKIFHKTAPKSTKTILKIIGARERDLLRNNSKHVLQVYPVNIQALNREYICKPYLLCGVHDDEQVESNLTAEKVARLQRRSQSKSKSWQHDFGASAVSWH